MTPVLSNKTDLSNIDLTTGFVVLIHKEMDWTSFDVVKKLRNFLKIKKIGHGGTLDPFATGLMLLGVGKGTKALHEIITLKKTYKAKIRFGQITDTYDRTGQVSETASTDALKREDIDTAIESMRGPMMQVPPMYSAKKVNGVRLYKLARKNVEVERPAQPVQVFKSRILNWENPYLDIELNVSKGTYIRSYAHDLGQKLGVGGMVQELERTAIDKYLLEDSFTLSEFMTAFRNINENSARTE